MTIPVLTKEELATFANKPEEYFTEYADTALVQASLLFRLSTCLTEMPTDPQMAELAKNAIVSMALNIYESDKYREMDYSPFGSETIGTYSYSISLAKIQAGQTTGINWFDMATSTLGVCDLVSGTQTSGGVEVFEHDGTFIPGQHSGNQRLLSPNDLNNYPNTPFWG